MNQLFMKVGDELKTDKGIATYVGDTNNTSYLVHLSPAPESNTQYDGVIDIIFSEKASPSTFIGSLPFCDVVDCGASNTGFKAISGVSITAEECRIIDDSVWRVISDKYNSSEIYPQEFVMVKDDENN